MSLIVLYLCYNTKSCSLTMLAAWMPLAAALQINIVNLWPSLWSTLRRICIPPEFEMLDVEFAPVQHGIRPLKKISAPGHNAELLYLSIHSFVFFTLSSASFFRSRLGSLSGLQHEASNIQTKKNIIQGQSPYWMKIQAPVTVASNWKGCSNSSEEWNPERMRDMVFMAVCVKTGCVAGWAEHKCRTQEQGS